MQLQNIRKEIARNLGVLSSDNSTIIEGRVTTAGINDNINRIYREVVLHPLMDKYPLDFERETEPLQTHRASFTVDATSSGTSLVATAAVFENMDVNYKVHNPTAGEKIEISAYTSGTAVTLASSPEASWSGDTVYILHNEFTFGGDVTDLKEITRVGLKYLNTDSEYVYAERRNRSDLLPLDNKEFTKPRPYWYLTTNLVDSVSERAFGILPYPSDYDGLIKLAYVEQPPILSGDTDEPRLEIAGISEVLISGTTAWAMRVQEKFQEATAFEEVSRDGVIQPRGLKNMMNNYKPKSRSTTSRRRLSTHYQALSFKRY